MRGRPTSARTFRSFLPIVVIAIIAAGVGGFAGGLIAAMSCDWNVKEAGCIESTAYGTVIGESVLMSVAVQAVIWPHRSLALVLLTPLTVGAIAVVGLLAPVGGEWSAVPVPIVQLIACGAIGWMALRPSRAVGPA